MALSSRHCASRAALVPESPCLAMPRRAPPGLAQPCPASPCRALPRLARPRRALDALASSNGLSGSRFVLREALALPGLALPGPAPPRHARPALLMGLPCAAQGAALLPAARDPCLASQPLAGSPSAKLSTPASKLMTTCFVSGGKFRNRRACGSGGCTGSRWGDIRMTV